MKDPFKSDNYRENLGFLKEAIKARDELVTIRHYNKTVRDLSQALEVVRKLVNSSIFPL
ncbi:MULTISPECIES: hypothetical protein [Wolbachia]|uniref:hypothetical protein n=1 Tax=Wolbachia TaxID=953 RepID=UPI0015FD7CF4|nr:MULTISPECIES: hypothetical protein [Wolbachia]MBA8753164.1 hypothetical protein [Wolbachia pipientis]MBA8754422.1 hypothetical protein [Wolbachia pipientis]QTG99593.1 hypothetical protein J5252_04615 [Wolbachia pipientis]UID81907.1 hypothetical protein J4T77_06245 [Wolbachia endosymbiont of Drosophila innubila]